MWRCLCVGTFRWVDARVFCSSKGGAIYSSAGTLSFSSCTFTSNSAVSCGEVCLAHLCVSYNGWSDLSRLGVSFDDMGPSERRGCVDVVVVSTIVRKCGSVCECVGTLLWF